MPRSPRKQSEADIYHVFARGVGRQLIFEDDADRAHFLSILRKLLPERESGLLAWALVGNHFHLLLQMRLQDLSELMRHLQASYAQYFNTRYDHVGHLFQGRFGSQPISGDEQLMAVVRYIHRNPIEAGMSKGVDYKWSSYRSYLRGGEVTDTMFVLEVFGGVDAFVEFHGAWDDKRFSFIDIEDSATFNRPIKMTDAQACERANEVLGKGWRENLSVAGKSQRDACLRSLKGAGLSVRQIERLTGLGRGVVSRA